MGFAMNSSREFPVAYPWHSTRAGPYRTASCWSDLLGFGASLDELGWDLDDPRAEAIVRRLLALRGHVSALHYGFDEETLFVNDGVIRTLVAESFSRVGPERHSLLSWLLTCLDTHCIVTGQEQDYGLPGIRTVICEGQVLRYFHERDPRSNDATAADLLPLSTQLNTALAKCYLAERAGHRIGLKRGGLYIEQSILDTLVSAWDCKLFDSGFLFLYGAPMLSPVSKYVFWTPLVHLSERLWDHEPFAHDRASWLKLGNSVRYDDRGLHVTLREVVAHSPTDEHSLLWFDTMRGDMHGFIFTDAGPAGTRYLTPKDEWPPLVREFREGYQSAHPTRAP